MTPISRLAERAKSALRKVPAAAAVNAAVRARATVAEYRTIGRQVQEFLASESYELRQLIEALRQTAENLEELSSSAKNDLGQTIFGDSPPRLAPGEPIQGGKR